jgi:proteic killer suppression protein
MWFIYPKIAVNAQWRLIVTLAEDEQGNYLTIIDIEDYH